MFAPLAIGLSVTLMAICLNLSSNEEIIKAVAAIVAIAGLLMSLWFAPLFVKMFIVAMVVLSNKFDLFNIGTILITKSQCPNDEHSQIKP